MKDRRLAVADALRNLTDRTDTPRRAPWVNGKPAPGTYAAKVWASVRRSGRGKLAPSRAELQAFRAEQAPARVRRKSEPISLDRLDS